MMMASILLMFNSCKKEPPILDAETIHSTTGNLNLRGLTPEEQSTADSLIALYESQIDAKTTAQPHFRSMLNATFGEPSYEHVQVLLDEELSAIVVPNIKAGQDSVYSMMVGVQPYDDEFVSIFFREHDFIGLDSLQLDTTDSGLLYVVTETLRLFADSSGIDLRGPGCPKWGKSWLSKLIDKIGGFFKKIITGPNGSGWNPFGGPPPPGGGTQGGGDSGGAIVWIGGSSGGGGGPNPCDDPTQIDVTNFDAFYNQMIPFFTGEEGAEFGLTEFSFESFFGEASTECVEAENVVACIMAEILCGIEEGMANSRCMFEFNHGEYYTAFILDMIDRSLPYFNNTGKNWIADELDRMTDECTPCTYDEAYEIYELAKVAYAAEEPDLECMDSGEACEAFIDGFAGSRQLPPQNQYQQMLDFIQYVADLCAARCTDYAEHNEYLTNYLISVQQSGGAATTGEIYDMAKWADMLRNEIIGRHLLEFGLEVIQVLEIAAFEYDLQVMNRFFRAVPLAKRTWAMSRVISYMDGTVLNLNNLEYAGRFGVNKYDDLVRIFADLGWQRSKYGIEFHHLVEQRFVTKPAVVQWLGQNSTGKWKSLALTVDEHQAFTNAWRQRIPYISDTPGPGGLNTTTATLDDIKQAASEVYANYPEILQALGL